MATRFSLAPVWLTVVALTATLAAQNVAGVGDTTAPPSLNPGHALIVGPHETVNPANGQVSLRFDVAVPPGRGMTPKFGFAYDSAGAWMLSWHPSTQAELIAQHTTLSSDGWSYTVPTLTFSSFQQSPDDASTCTISDDYVYQGGDGQRRPLNLSITGYASRPAYDDPCDVSYQEHTLDQAADGWRATTPAIVDAFYRNLAVTLTDPDGTVMSFAANSTPAWGVPAYAITDRNGNSMSVLTCFAFLVQS